jgi:hypothetical protein
MRVDLSDRQRSEHLDQGKITGADECAYSRRGTKTKRSVCDELVEAGAPLVLYMYSSGQFEWFDGSDASEAWADVHPYVIATDPTTKQLAKHEMWTAGIWESDEGRQLIYLTGSC